MTLTPAQEWWTPEQIAESDLPDLPSTKRGVNALADRLNWRAVPKFARRRAGKGGGWQYSWKLFPNAAQRALIRQAVAPKSSWVIHCNRDRRCHGTLQRALDARGKAVPAVGVPAVAGASQASGADEIMTGLPLAAEAVMVAGAAYALWLAWRYRDQIAAAIQSPLPRVADQACGSG